MDTTLSKKHAITVLIIIILLGAILRFYNLGATSFVADEFLDVNSSMAYAKTGHWQAWDFNNSAVDKENINQPRDERAAIYKWQVAQVLKLGKPSEASARFVSVIWGLISIVLIYFVATYFTRKKEIGLIAAFLFAVSIVGIVFDRRLRMYSMFFPVFLAFSWMAYRFLEEEYKGKVKLAKFFYEKWKVNLAYFLPAIILGVISLMVHQLTGNIVIAIFFYALIQFVITRKKEKLFYNKYFLIVVVAILGFIAAQIIVPAKVASFTKELVFFTSHWVYLGKIVSDYSHPLLGFAFLFWGLYFLFRKEKLIKEALWLEVSLFSILLAAILIWKRNTGDQYIFFIESFSMILVASGIYAMADFLGENLSKYGKKAYFIPLLASLIILPNYAYFFQSDNTYNQTSDSDSANYKKIFSYFRKADKPGDVLVTRNFRNFYWSGAKMKVFSFGGEISNDKLTLDEIQSIVNENPSGWFIFSDNDDVYISNDAVDWAGKNLEKVSNSYVRGKVSVYRWGNN